jgi:phosphohistidine phosphatase
MRELLVMRHAKSDWESGASTDFERPLNKRGLKAAAFMGSVLKERQLIPDLIIHSPAKRAKKTFQLLSKEMDYTGDVLEVKGFYFGGVSEVYEQVRAIGDDYKRVLIIGHNPTWEQLVEELTAGRNHVTMPTAAIARVLLSLESWADVMKSGHQLDWLITPKMLNSEL